VPAGDGEIERLAAACDAGEELVDGELLDLDVDPERAQVALDDLRLLRPRRGTGGVHDRGRVQVPREPLRPRQGRPEGVDGDVPGAGDSWVQVVAGRWPAAEDRDGRLLPLGRESAAIDRIADRSSHARRGEQRPARVHMQVAGAVRGVDEILLV